MPKTEEQPLRASLRTYAFIVTHGGKPCTIANVTGARKGGVLLPGTPVAVYLKSRDARRAIARTQRVADSLRGSLIDSWDKLQPLFSGGVYEVQPLARQS